MNSDELFENWKQDKADFAVSDNFCENIMQTVAAPKKRKPRVDLLVWFNALTAEPLMRFGIIVIGAIGGLCRITLMLLSFVCQAIPLT
jgi:hypothetical protein